MNKETMIIAASIFASIYALSTLIYFIFRRYMRAEQEALKRESARLDDFRAHLERQLFELNMRFSSNEERWRELNHLVIAGQRYPTTQFEDEFKFQKSRFLKSHGLLANDLKIINDQIFVLTPFHDEFKDEFDATVKVGQELGFKVLRGDERAGAGEIFPQLLRYLVQSRLIVANISGRNPNVFYELGIAHAIDKPVILLAHNKSDVPFDVQSKQIVFYKDNRELEERLTKALSRTLISNEPNK